MKMQFSEKFGLHIDELSQLSAITTQTVTIPGGSGIKTEKRQFWEFWFFENCRFSVLIPDSPGIVTVLVVIALNWLNSSRWSPKFSENCIFVISLVISLTEEITQPDEKWSPELKIFAGVQRESCSKKYKKNLGLGPNVRRRLTKNSGDAGLHYFSVISLNRRNKPAWQKVFAKVENFRRSTTRKLLEKMKNNFGSWSRCAEMLNEKLRRSG